MQIANCSFLIIEDTFLFCLLLDYHNIQIEIRLRRHESKIPMLQVCYKF